MMRMAPRSHAAAFALVAVLACGDRSPVDPAAEVPVPTEAVAAMTCTADVEAGALTCAPRPAGQPDLSPGVRAAITLGGQDTYVRVTSTDAAYDDGVEVFSADVAVQNLTAWAMGTTDGSTPDPDGTRVFFHSGPATTGGAGTVAVRNASGMGSFTGSEQPYFQYDGIVGAYGETERATWEWDVPSTVDSFEFEVYVHTSLIREDGVLRWERVTGPPSGGTFTAVHGFDTGEIFVGTTLGFVLSHDGDDWFSRAVPLKQNSGWVNDIWGPSARDVYVVGYERIVHWDGREWSVAHTETGEAFESVWGTSADNVYAGTGSGTIQHFDGDDWTEVPVDWSSAIDAIGGSGPDDIIAAGAQTGILHYDGVDWDTLSAPNPGGLYLRDVIVPSDSSAYLTGSDGLLLHWDGSAIDTLDAGTTASLYGIWGFGPDDLWITTNDRNVLEWTGVEWDATPLPLQRSSIRDIWGPSPDSLFAVGDGEIALWNGTSWSSLFGMPDEDMSAVSATSASDVHAVGWSVALHYDGAAWDTVPAPFTGMRDVWAASTSAAFMVGASGDIAHWDGTAWTGQTSPVTTSLVAAHGSSATDVYAVGYEFGVETYVLHYDGDGWESVHSESGSSVDYRDVWVDGSGTAYVLKDDAVVTGSADGGWSEQAIPGASGLNGIWGTDAGELFVVGSGGTVFHYDGGSWSSLSSGVSYTLRAVWGTSGGDVYAVGNNGAIHFDGVQWTSVETGAERNNYLDVTGTSPTNLYIVGSDDLVLHGTR